ncbi:hypothetical protein HGRIS_008362 [Hohenbuehelia grisea]|uniref:Lysine-specific metallo-endopeptidase domain-containing protein n=1 Tax=Hohenbuehelia grisea TaxID=104357 RepID=A0ABR3J7R6_9AGAR
MFSASSITSILIGLVLTSLSVSATPGLSLKTSAPEEVDGVSNLKIITTVTNTGDERLKLLNDPRTPLSSVPAYTFTVSNPSGAAPSFNGMMLKYVPEVAAKSGNEGTFTILEPGESVKVEHDLSTVYDFTAAGAGKYNFKSRNLFYYVDENNDVMPIYANTTSDHATSIRGKLAITRPAFVKRARFNSNCDSLQRGNITKALVHAEQYARQAKDYLSTMRARTSSRPVSALRYVKWFGSDDTTKSRSGTVFSHFSNMTRVEKSFSSFTYDCSCKESNVYAYVYPDQFGQIYLCGAFWKAPFTGTDSKAGTLIHEASHFKQNGGTTDTAYGQSACQKLAQSNPAQAVKNADSHEYFAENTPYSS